MFVYGLICCCIGYPINKKASWVVQLAFNEKNLCQITF
jgi:hypothetical protein